MWRVAAAELDAYRRAYGLDHPGPAKHVRGRVAWDGRAAVPAAAPTAAERSGGTGERAHRRGDLGRPTVAVDRRHRADRGRLLGAEPRRDTPGRRRDWQVAQAALEHLAGWGRHRDHRPPNRGRPGRSLGRQERDGR